jgi:hypothetical protein
MLKILPWDIWAAAALATGVLLAAIFEPTPIAVFIVIYLGLCAYIVVKTFSGKLQ